ncbi:hypothetical protein K457DRAFT_1879814 [Linnemannia elongata AG-77]|uniref:Uncharacterized protein n=1 Tax=Linnemannia elongata AG-77 TaxID=1314771 RepID=A0A197JLH2_9FUNG|nr:hypothetical protein K457DRAFT_1879814 [Linnemannia elongata AG-77]
MAAAGHEHLGSDAVTEVVVEVVACLSLTGFDTVAVEAAGVSERSVAVVGEAEERSAGDDLAGGETERSAGEDLGGEGAEWSTGDGLAGGGAERSAGDDLAGGEVEELVTLVAGVY